MRKYLKGFAYLLYFIFAQCAATMILFFRKMLVDEDWCYRLYDQLLDGNMTGYMTSLSEILFPALIVADILIILPMIIGSIRKKEKLFSRIKIRNAWGIVAIATIANVAVSEIVDLIPQSSDGSYSQLMSIVTNGDFWTVLLVSGILAPIVEEFIFRYAIIGCMRDKHKNFAIIYSAAIFGIAHMNIIQSAYAFLFGLILGWMYVQQKNLARNILFHITVNAGSIIYEYADTVFRVVIWLFIAVCLLWVYDTVRGKDLSQATLEDVERYA